MKDKYNPKDYHRCASNYCVSYTMLKKQRVVLSVYHNSNKRTDGDGKIFGNIDLAREYAYNKGYIVKYDPKEGQCK